MCSRENVGAGDPLNGMHPTCLSRMNFFRFSSQLPPHEVRLSMKLKPVARILPRKGLVFFGNSP